MKTCSKCGLTKPLDEFQKRTKNKDGYTGICKLCKREYDNAHYKANPERRQYIRTNSNQRVLLVRAWLRKYLETHPCVDCGESDIVVLEFDHREDKIDHVSNLIRSGNLLSVQTEVAKCDIRCANCHRRKTARDFGNWRLILEEQTREAPSQGPSETRSKPGQGGHQPQRTQQANTQQAAKEAKQAQTQQQK